MLRSTSWAGAASVAWVAGVAVAAVAVLISAPGIASAQTPVPVPPSAEPGASALVAARELFREAGQDADAGKFALALEKYRRVAAVKETGQVRFNIARCEEQLGQIASALADYELVERDMHDAHGDAENELRGTSRERGNALRPRVPRLTLKGPLPQPPSFVVRRSPDEAGDHHEGPDAALEAADERRHLLGRLDRLDDRERTIVSLRFGLDGDDPMTLKEVGRRLGVTREWVRKIEVRAVKKLDGDAPAAAPAAAGTKPRRRKSVPPAGRVMACRSA